MHMELITLPLHVEMLNKLSIETAVYVLGFEAYPDYTRQCVKTVSVEELDQWAMSLEDSPRAQYITSYRGNDIPYRFLLWLIVYHYKNRTLLERKVQRWVADQPPSTVGLRKEEGLDVARAINDVVLNLPWQEGAEYLGMLTGIWLLSCPESSILADPDCVKEFARVRNKGTQPGGPFSSLVRAGKMTEDDFWLTAVLDHYLYLTYDFEL